MKKRIISVICLAVLVLTLFNGCSLSDLAKESAPKIKYKIIDEKAIVTELPNKTTVTAVEIPDEYDGYPVTEIADFAGCNLESMEEIKIGKNVETIGTWALENNRSLKNFVVSEENKSFCSPGGVLYTKDMKTLLFFPAKNTKEYVIPDSVETLRTKSFYKCSELEKLTLPKNLKSIEEKVFFRCGALQNVKLPDTLEYIGKDAFGYCSALTEITVPSTVTEIGEYAFYNCNALLNVTMEGKETEMKLGKSWYPTDNGLEIDKLQINWK